MRFNIFLKTYRKIHSLTQKELAYDLGITREYYARLESGLGKPSFSLLDRICSQMDLDCEWLVNNNGGPTKRNDLFEMCDICARLRREDRKEIGRLMKRLVNGRHSTGRLN